MKAKALKAKGARKMAVSNSPGSGKAPKQEDQLLRRAFDTVYEFDVNKSAQEASDRLRRINRRTRWIIITAIAALVLFGVIAVIMTAALQDAQRRAEPTIEERLAAPFELSNEAIGMSANIGMPYLEGYIYEKLTMDTLHPVLACMLSPDSCELSYGNVIIAEAVIEGEIVAEEAETDEAAATGAEAGEEEEIPTADLMVFADVQRILGGFYTNNETQMPVRVSMAKFSSADEAWHAIISLNDYSRANGRVGAQVLSLYQPVNYYLASVNGWQSFAWLQEDTVFVVEAHNWEEVTTMMETLRSLPPLQEESTDTTRS